MCGGDAAFRQITLTTCYHYHHHYQLLLHPRDGCDNNNNNKSSAVAEMGDRLAKIDMGQKDGGGYCAPFWRESGAPSNTMWPGTRSTPVSSGLFIHPFQPFDHSRHGPKSGGCCAPRFRGSWIPNLTQCRMGRGLPPYQVAS